MSGDGVVWRGMDRATVESEYPPSLPVPSLQTYVEWYAERSAVARAGLPHERVPYGDHPERPAGPRSCGGQEPRRRPVRSARPRHPLGSAVTAQLRS